MPMNEIDYIGLLLIPMSVFAGFLLKRKDMDHPNDKWVYVICSTLMAYTAPEFIIDYFSLSSGKDFITFVIAVFGGLIILNMWTILSNTAVLKTLISMFIKLGSKES
jgi:hypothetical protein